MEGDEGGWGGVEGDMRGRKWGDMMEGWRGRGGGGYVRKGNEGG